MATKTTLWIFLSFFSGTVFCEIQIPFWVEDFTAGIPSAWQTDDELGNVTWEYCSDYQQCPPVGGSVFGAFDIFNDYQFNSNSYADGYAFIAPVGQGETSTPHRSYILTNSIDCSDKSEVFLQFNNLMISGESIPETDAVVEVRAGNGPWNTFTVFKNLNPDLMDENFYGFQSYNPQTVWLDLTAVAANEENVQIRWVWEWTGNEVFFWGIDDVELLDEDPNDLPAVWGNQPGEGDFAGSLGEWTVLSQGQCGWGWDAEGLVDTPDLSDEANFYTCSPSIENGVALINASECVVLTFPFSTSVLISPDIDLSSVAQNSPLALQFHQTGSLGNPAVENETLTKILVSTDGGASFLDTINVNSEKAFFEVFSELKTIPLPLGIAGSPQVQVRFIFSGDFIFWAIDDVKIVERNENDLAVSENFFSVAPNFATPASAETPISFSVRAENVGATAQENVKLFAAVYSDETGEQIFLDSLLVGEMEVDETLENAVFPNSFLPTSEAKNYSIKYWVQGEELDENEIDNSIEQKFEISKDLFSKNRGRKSIISAGFAPNTSLNYEIGNCFFIPPGSDLKATHISFAFNAKSTMQGVNLLIQLYKWKTDDTFADANGDTLANANEFVPISFNEYVINGNENLREIHKVPISVDEPFLELEDSTYYFVTVDYKAETGSDDVFQIAACEDIDYTAMFYQSILSGKPQYVSVLRLGGDDFFRVNSWGLKRIPFVQLHVQKPPTKVVERNEERLRFSVFPNPASELLNVESHFENLGGETHYEIFDVFGRLVFSSETPVKSVSQTSIPIGELSNGTYLVRVSSGERSGSQMFFVQSDR